MGRYPSMLAGILRRRRSAIRLPASPTPRRDSVQILSAIAQAIFAGVVAYYTFRADVHARAQIEPAFDAEVSIEKELVIENAGRDPILDVFVTPALASIADGKISSRTGSWPAVPGEKPQRFWRVERLNAGEIQRRSLLPVLKEAIELAKMDRWAASKGGLTSVTRKDPFIFAVVALRITYRREADGRRFKKDLRVVATEVDSGAIYVHRGGMYWKFWGDAIERVTPDDW